MSSLPRFQFGIFFEDMETLEIRLIRIRQLRERGVHILGYGDFSASFDEILL